MRDTLTDKMTVHEASLEPLPLQLRSMRVVDSHDPAVLPMPELEDLAASAAEPNVFYEPLMLGPAISSFGAAESFRFVLVYAHGDGASGAAPQLCGFFPFVEKRRYAGLPVRTLSFWRYDDCALCTPLVRSGYENDCLDALLDWAGRQPRSALLDWCLATGDGPIHSALLECLDRRGWSRDVTRRARPLLRPHPDSTSYLQAAMSSSHRSKLKQKERRLSEAGVVSYKDMSVSGCDEWIDAFLRLEASGWKGRQGTAVASSEVETAFFRTVIQDAGRRGRLQALALCVGGVPVAVKCNLAAGSGSFAFKIAYDAQFSRYSAGELLEVENIRRIHETAGIQWMDSCVDESFEHFYRWLDERVIETVVFSTGRRWPDAVLGLLPAVRRLKQILRRSKAAARRVLSRRSKTA